MATERLATDQRASAMSQAKSALARLAKAPDALDDPLLVVALQSSREADLPVDVRPLLDSLMSTTVSYGRENSRRYRWGLSWRAAPGSTVYGLAAEQSAVHFRPAEAEFLVANASAYGQRLMEPIVLAAQFGFWGGVAADPASDGDVARLAAELLTEATPLAEHDLARWFAALDPWRDTLALWLLTAEPAAMSYLRDMLFSLALRYGAIAARDGLVRGIRYPFYGQPLVSANAQLAGGLWRCGIYPSVIPRLVNFVADARDDEGGWSDGGQPADPLTTLAAADLLTRLDPGFDPEPTVGWFARRQEPAGWWRALNPEVPWLTAAVVRWMELAERPFAERFSWPSSPIWSRDRLSGLTTIATLEELELMLDGLPRLREARVEMAFLDLAGFGAWNNAHGQAAGDELIALLGRTLRELPGVLPVRIGGDEFLLLGKPTDSSGSLEATLDAWRCAWPRQQAERSFDQVAPRIVVGAARAYALPQLRRELGEAIARLKSDCPRPPAEGVLRRWAP